jgi:cyclophilin family peptidyl-prolyl cis-trans isomerase
VLAQLAEKYPKDVRVVFRHFPLPSHSLALPAAQAAEAAGLQGKFWQMHDALFAGQAEWASLTADQFNEWAAKKAGELGLNKDQFVKDMSSTTIVDKVKAAQDHGSSIGIPGTPFMLLNGQIYQGPRDLASLEVILNLFQLEDRQFTYCPPMVIDPKKSYTATLKTDKGDIVIDLYADKAPLAVNSFVFLAQQKWFNGVTFHRVIPDFVAQAGDPSGSGMGGPGYSFADEITDLKFDKAGVVGMANSGPGSNGSQFFITFKEAPNLDGKYTVFGQVTQGLDVLKQLTPRDPSQELGLPPGDKILDVTITEK